MALEDEIAEQMAREIQKEIDWGVMADLLVESGWTKVKLPNKFLPVSGIELHQWREKNLTGKWKAHEDIWLFEKEKDATIFILRWV